MSDWKRIHLGIHHGVPSQFHTDDSGHIVALPAAFCEAFMGAEPLNVDLVPSAIVPDEVEIHRDGTVDAAVPHSLLVWLIQQREQTRDS
jgi:hypothetical protein